MTSGTDSKCKGHVMHMAQPCLNDMPSVGHEWQRAQLFGLKDHFCARCLNCAETTSSVQVSGHIFLFVMKTVKPVRYHLLPARSNDQYYWEIETVLTTCLSGWPSTQCGRDVPPPNFPAVVQWRGHNVQMTVFVNPEAGFTVYMATACHLSGWGVERMMEEQVAQVEGPEKLQNRWYVRSSMSWNGLWVWSGWKWTWTVPEYEVGHG